MNHVEQYLSVRLNEREIAGNLRQLSLKRADVDFFSNDYLGIATKGLLVKKNSDTDQEKQYLSGSTGSRLLSGNSRAVEELEQEIANFHNAQGALLFNSGYDANVGLLSCIAGRHTTILYDELCHASLLDGIRLAQCVSKYNFRHNDISHLEDKLKKHAGNGQILVVLESVYSMDGDIASLTEIALLCERYEAQMVVDEAHATGVIGRHGEGLVCSLGLADKVFARVHTFGKALGAHGAAVVGSDLLKQYLVNFARPFIFSTALPGAAIAAISSAYGYLSAPDFSNQPLHELIAYFRSKVESSRVGGWKDSNTAIQALVLGDSKLCRALAAKLQNSGLQVNPILSPTVPLGAERLRICLHTFNTVDQVDMLFECL